MDETMDLEEVVLALRRLTERVAELMQQRRMQCMSNQGAQDGRSVRNVPARPLNDMSSSIYPFIPRPGQSSTPVENYGPPSVYSLPPSSGTGTSSNRFFPAPPAMPSPLSTSFNSTYPSTGQSTFQSTPSSRFSNVPLIPPSPLSTTFNSTYPGSGPNTFLSTTPNYNTWSTPESFSSNYGYLSSFPNSSQSTYPNDSRRINPSSMGTSSWPGTTTFDGSLAYDTTYLTSPNTTLTSTTNSPYGNTFSSVPYSTLSTNSSNSYGTTLTSVPNSTLNSSNPPTTSQTNSPRGQSSRDPRSTSTDPSGFTQSSSDARGRSPVTGSTVTSSSNRSNPPCCNLRCPTCGSPFQVCVSPSNSVQYPLSDSQSRITASTISQRPPGTTSTPTTRSTNSRGILNSQINDSSVNTGNTVSNASVISGSFSPASELGNSVIENYLVSAIFTSPLCTSNSNCSISDIRNIVKVSSTTKSEKSKISLSDDPCSKTSSYCKTTEDDLEDETCAPKTELDENNNSTNTYKENTWMKIYELMKRVQM